MKLNRILLLLLSALAAACSAHDPLVGSFSGRQTDGPDGPGHRTDEVLRFRIGKKDNAYSMSVWHPGKKGWDEVKARVLPCTLSEVTGATSKDTDAVIGVCVERGKTGLFYVPDRSIKERVPGLSKLTSTEYLLFLAFPMGGTIWEVTRD